MDFIIDSGAEKSAIPRSLVPPSLLFPCTTRLSGVDGKPLRTYGHCIAQVGIRSLRRDFKVQFIVTDTKAILGADFLTEYALNLDMSKRKLTDTLSNIAAPLQPCETEEQIRVYKSDEPNNFIEKHCPILLTPPDYSSIPSKMSTLNAIETQ